MRCGISLAVLMIGSLLAVFVLTGPGQAGATPLPPSEGLVKSKLSDTLKSVTSNVSSTIKSDIDKVISSTMDVLIDSSLSQLNSSTILENSDSPSTVKFNAGAKLFSMFDISR